MTLCIAGIGEVLMDVFEDGTATVGGAPINVAFHAHQLLTSAGRGTGAVVSAVGEDDRGRRILTTLAEAGLSDRYVTRDPHHPTGTATVFVQHGEAVYDIAPDVAWDHLPDDDATRLLATQCAAVAFGSLAQRTAPSARTIQRFASLVQGHRLYDVNLRTNATDGAHGYSRAILEESCEVATIVKANAGEIDEVLQLLGLPASEPEGEAKLWSQMQQLLDHYQLAAVVVTRGALGALLLGSEGRVQLPDSTLPLASVHPVGAGDAFSAGLLYGLCIGCNLAQSARLADRLASWVTGYPAATPALTPEIMAELRALESSVA